MNTMDTWISELLKRAKARGIDPAEVYTVSREGMEIATRGGALEKYEASNTFGLSLRGMVQGRMGYASTQVLDEAAMEMLLRAVEESAALVQSEDPQEIYGGSESYPQIETLSPALDAVPADDRIALALRVEKAATTQDPRVTELEENRLHYSKGGVRLTNSYGLDLAYEDNGAQIMTYAVAREESNTSVGAGYCITRDLAAFDPEGFAAEAVARAVDQLGAASMESGVLPVVLDRDVMADLLRTFCGVFSAENAQQGLSLLAGREGEAIAAPIVTLMDDPLLPGGHSSRGFDDEGVATQTKAVIEGGVLKTLLHNLMTAKKGGAASTGNGMRAGYSGPVRVSPTNFFIQAGESTQEQLFAQAGEGVFITEVDGLHAGANAVSGDFSLSARGFRIQGGQRGTPVKQITISGNFFTLLKEITALGNDLSFDMGSLASPSVLVKQLSIAGK